MYGRVVVIKRSGHLGGRYAVQTQQCYIGSDKNCDIRISIPYVAQHHCVIKALPNKQAVVKNLSKTGSTLLNGEPISECSLKHLDLISICGRHFQWEYPVGSQFYRWNDQSENMSAMVEVPVNIFKKRRRSDSALLKAKPKKLIAVVSPQPRNNPTENVADAASVSERGNSVGFSRFTVVNKKDSSGKGRKTMHNFNFHDNTEGPANKRLKKSVPSMSSKMSFGAVGNETVSSTNRPSISEVKSPTSNSMNRKKSIGKSTLKIVTPAKVIQTPKTPASKRKTPMKYPAYKLTSGKKSGVKSTPKVMSLAKATPTLKARSPRKETTVKSPKYNIRSEEKSVGRLTQKVVSSTKVNFSQKTPSPRKGSPVTPAYNIKSGKKSIGKLPQKVVSPTNVNVSLKTPSPRKRTPMKSPTYNINSGKKSVRKSTPKVVSPINVNVSVKTPSPRKGTPVRSPTNSIKSGKKSVGQSTPEIVSPAKVTLTPKTPGRKKGTPEKYPTYNVKSGKKSVEKSTPKIESPKKANISLFTPSPREGILLKSPPDKIKSEKKSVGQLTPKIMSPAKSTFTSKTPSPMKGSPAYNLKSGEKSVGKSTAKFMPPAKATLTPKTPSPKKETAVKSPTYNLKRREKYVGKSTPKVESLMKVNVSLMTPNPREETPLKSPADKSKNGKESIGKSTPEIMPPAKAILTPKTPSPRKGTPLKSPTYNIKSGKKSFRKPTPKKGLPMKTSLTPKTPTPQKETAVESPTYNTKSGKKSVRKSTPKVVSPTKVNVSLKTSSPRKVTPVKSPTYNIKSGKKSGKSTPKISAKVVVTPETLSRKKGSPVYNLKSGKKSFGEPTPKKGSPIKASLTSKTPTPRKETAVESPTYNIISGKKFVRKSTPKIVSPTNINVLLKTPSPRKVTPVKSPTYNIKSGKKSVGKSTPKIKAKVVLTPETPSHKKGSPVYNLKSGKKSFGEPTPKKGSPMKAFLTSKTPTPRKETAVESPTYNIISGKKSVRKSTPKIVSPTNINVLLKTPNPRKVTPVKSPTYNIKSGKKSVGKSTPKITAKVVLTPETPSHKKGSPVYNLKSGKKSFGEPTPKKGSPMKAFLTSKTPTPRKETAVESPTYNISGKKSVRKSTPKIVSPANINVLLKTPSPRKVTPVKSPTYNIKSGKKSVGKPTPKISAKVVLTPETLSHKKGSPVYNLKSGKKSVGKPIPRVESSTNVNVTLKTPSPRKGTPLKFPTYNVKSGKKSFGKPTPKVGSPVKSSRTPKTPTPRKEAAVESPTDNIKSGKKSVRKSTPKVVSPTKVNVSLKSSSPRKVTPVKSPTYNIKSGKKSVGKSTPKILSSAKVVLTPETPSPKKGSPAYNLKSGKKSFENPIPRVESSTNVNVTLKTPSPRKVTPLKSPTYNIKSGKKSVGKSTPKVDSPTKLNVSLKTPSSRKETPVKSPTYNIKSGKKSVGKSTPKIDSPTKLNVSLKTPSPRKGSPVKSPTDNIKNGKKSVGKSTPKILSSAKVVLTPETPSPKKGSPAYNLKSGKKSFENPIPRVESSTNVNVTLKTPSPRKVTPLKSPTYNIKSGKKSVGKSTPKVDSPTKLNVSLKTPSSRKETPVKSPTYNIKSGKKSVGKSTPKVDSPTKLNVSLKTPSSRKETPVKSPTYNIKSGKKSVGKSTPKVDSPTKLNVSLKTPSPRKETPVKSPIYNIKGGKKSVGKPTPKKGSPIKASPTPVTPSCRKETPVRSSTYNIKSEKTSVRKSTPKILSAVAVLTSETPSPTKGTTAYNLKSGKKSFGKPSPEVGSPMKACLTPKTPSPRKKTSVKSPTYNIKSEKKPSPSLELPVILVEAPSPKTPGPRKETQVKPPIYNIKSEKKSVRRHSLKVGSPPKSSFALKTPTLLKQTLIKSQMFNVRSARKSVGSPTKVTLTPKTPTPRKGTPVKSPSYNIRSGKKSVKITPEIGSPTNVPLIPETPSPKKETLVQSPKYSFRSGKKSVEKTIPNSIKETPVKSPTYGIKHGRKSTAIFVVENIDIKSLKTPDSSKTSSTEKESVVSRNVKSGKKSVVIATPETGTRPSVSLFRRTPYRNTQASTSENSSVKNSAKQFTRNSSGSSDASLSPFNTKGKRKRESTSDRIQSTKKLKTDTSEVNKKTLRVQKSATTQKKNPAKRNVASSKKHGRRIQSAKKLTTETPRSYKKKMAALLVLHAKGKFNIPKRKPLFSDIVKARAQPPSKKATSVSVVPLPGHGVRKHVPKRYPVISVAPLRLTANTTGHVNSPETIIIRRSNKETKPQSVPRTRRERKSTQPVITKIQTADKSFDGIPELFKTPHQVAQQNETAESSALAHRPSSTRVRFSTAKNMSPTVSVRSLDLISVSGIKCIKTPPSVLKKSSRPYVGTPFPNVTARLNNSSESPLAKELNSSFPDSVKTPQLNRKSSVKTSFSGTTGSASREIADSTPKSTTKLKPLSSRKKSSTISLQDTNQSYNSGRRTRNYSLLNMSSTSVSGRKIPVQETTFSPLSIISGNSFTSVTTSGKKSVTESTLSVIFSDHDNNSGGSSVVDRSVSPESKRKQKPCSNNTSATADSLELFITNSTSQESRRKTRSIQSESISKSDFSVRDNSDPQKLSTPATSPGLVSIEVDAVSISRNMSATNEGGQIEPSKRRSHPSVASLELKNSGQKTRRSVVSDYANISKLLTPDQTVAETGSQRSSNRRSRNHFAVSTPKDTIAHRSPHSGSASRRKVRNSSSVKMLSYELPVNKSSRGSETIKETYELPSEVADFNSSKNFGSSQEVSSSGKRKSRSGQRSLLLDISSNSSEHENTRLSSDITKFDFNAVATPNVSKEMFVSPISVALKRQSVKNDLSDVQGIKRIMSPLANSPSSSYENVQGIKRLVKTPRKSSETVGVSEIKKLFTASPVADYTDVKGVKRLLTTPKSQMGYTDVEGIKKLFDRNIPASDYTDVIGIKQIYRKRSPKSSYLDVTGVRRIFKEDKSPQSPMLVGVECLFESPKSVSVDQLAHEPSTSGEKGVTPEVKKKSRPVKKTHPLKKSTRGCVEARSLKPSTSPVEKRRKIIYTVTEEPVHEDVGRRPTRSRQTHVKKVEHLFESPKRMSVDKHVQTPSASIGKRGTPVRKTHSLRKSTSVSISPVIKKRKVIHEEIQDLVHEEDLSRRQTRNRQTYVEKVKTAKDSKETKTEVVTQNNQLHQDTGDCKGREGKKLVQHTSTSETDHMGEKENKTLKGERRKSKISAQDNSIAEAVSAKCKLKRTRNQLSSKDQETSDLKSQSSNRLNSPRNETRTRKRVADTTSEETANSTAVFPGIKRHKIENVSTAQLNPDQVSSKRSTRKRGGNISKNETSKVEQTIIKASVIIETKSKEVPSIQTRNTGNMIDNKVIASPKTSRKTRNQVPQTVVSETDAVFPEKKITITEIIKENVQPAVKKNVRQNIKDVKGRKEEASDTVSGTQLKAADNKHIKVTRKTRTDIEKEKPVSPGTTKRITRKNKREANKKPDSLSPSRRKDARQIDEDSSKVSKQVSTEGETSQSKVRSQKSKETVVRRTRQEKNESPMLKRRTRNQISDTDIKESPKIMKTRNKIVSEDAAESKKQKKEIEDKHDNIINIGSSRTRRKVQVDNIDAAKHDVTVAIVRGNKNRGKENISESTESSELKNIQPAPKKNKIKGKSKQNKNVNLVDEIIETVRPQRNVLHSAEKISKSTTRPVRSSASQKKVQFHTSFTGLPTGDNEL